MQGYMKQRNPFAFVAPAVVSVLILGGCAEIDKLTSPGPELSPAPIPDYAVAELYVYDNGRTETVIAKDGDVLTWRTNNGVVRQAYHNFIVPYLSWQTSTRRGTSETNATANMLWPLQVGNTEKFNFVRTAEDNDGGNRREYRQSWQCKVTDTETVRITLGSYDTFRIVCHRYSGNSWRQTRTFYYAPKVGHYVLRRDDYRSGPSERRELAEFGFNSSVFSVAEQQDLTKTVQKSLSENANGQAINWRGATSKVVINITPLTTETDSKGLVCRRYQGVIYNQSRTRANGRYACRQTDGVWVHSVIK